MRRVFTEIFLICGIFITVFLWVFFFSQMDNVSKNTTTIENLKAESEADYDIK